MAIPYKMETSGVHARYEHSGEGWMPFLEVLRPVIAWDEEGRPLVLAGDRLEPAADAEFANWPSFRELVPGNMVEKVQAGIRRQPHPDDGGW